MRRHTLTLAICAITTSLTAPQALAGTFLPIAAPPGSSTSAVLGVNDSADIAGSYSTTGVDEHGFVGPINSSYTTFDFGSTGTQARSINNSGQIVGIFQTRSVGGACFQNAPPGPTSCLEFVRAKNGALAMITKAGVPLVGIAHGQNAAGVFVGDYWAPTETPRRRGYQGKNATYQSEITLPFPSVTVRPRAVNNQGDVVGFFLADGLQQGFLIKNGVTTILNFPDPGVTGTFPEGVNNHGQISGSWSDADGVSHGFVLQPDLTSWTSLDAPGAANTQAWQINIHGQIAINGFDADGNNTQMFLYCPTRSGVCNGADRPGREKAIASALFSPPAGRHSADADAPPRGRMKQQ